jgi:hypothetical protein
MDNLSAAYDNLLFLTEGSNGFYGFYPASHMSNSGGGGMIIFRWRNESYLGGGMRRNIQFIKAILKIRQLSNQNCE